MNQIAEAYKTVVQFRRDLKPFGLSASRALVLASISENTPMHQIEEELDMIRERVYTFVLELEYRGLVKRSPIPEGLKIRRQFPEVSLTPAGREKLAQIQEAVLK